MEKIKGIVQKINLYNENNGYGIIRIKIDYHDKEMAQYQHLLVSNILGVICTFDRKPYEDEEYIFLGEFVTSNYGIQLKASSFERCIKESKNSIIKYLASDLFPGIGEATATKVYNALGDNALTKIIEDKNSLDKVNITNKQKNILYQNVLLQSKTNQQLFSMIQLGLSNNVANRIIHTLGDDALNILKENPYQLIYEVEGIGFKTADGIAQMLHIEKSNPNRLKGIILYVYGEMIHNSGNTYEYIEDVQKNCYLFTNVEEEILNKDLFIKLLNELKEEKRIIIEDNSLFFPKYYYEEIKVARNIYSFLNNNNNDYSFDKIKSVINKVMEINGITYTLKQQEAIEKALKEPIVIITGGPGTGKSTVIKGIVDCYKAMFKNEEIINEKIALVAPTGRASKRLKEVTGHDACTIHKILGYEGNDYFTVTEDSPLDIKMIIIDEFSMVDISLASLLFQALLPTTKIVIVGDNDQLPSVGVGDVLLDLIESKEITTIRLDKIHRQASDSSIITLAHYINQGMVPEDVKEVKKDRCFNQYKDSELINGIKKVVEKGIEMGMDLIKDIQVLIPKYKGDIGIDNVNVELQSYFNPSDKEVVYNNQRFRVNDKVIQTINRREKKVMNGDIGYVLSIDRNDGTYNGLNVMFDFGSVHYDKEEIGDLNLAYAISIHKAQGSEFPLVIVPFSFQYYRLLKRKLIYTAITRAKKNLIMMGNFDAFHRGIVQIEEKRKTKLSLRIKMIIENPNRIFDNDSAFDEIIIEDFAANEMQDLIEMENISPYDFMKDDNNNNI